MNCLFVANYVRVWAFRRNVIEKNGLRGSSDVANKEEHLKITPDWCVQLIMANDNWKHELQEIAQRTYLSTIGHVLLVLRILCG